jgi:hypothetical protein
MSAYTPVQTNPELTGCGVNAVDRMMAHRGAGASSRVLPGKTEAIHMDEKDRKSLAEVRGALGVVAAWAGGTALLIGGLLWLDSQGKKSG